MRFRITLVLSLLFILLAGKSTAFLTTEAETFDSRFNSMVEPWQFNFAGWEIKTLAGEFKDKLFYTPSHSGLTPGTVLSYFSCIVLTKKLQGDIQSIQTGRSVENLEDKQAELKQAEGQRDSLRGIVEATISEQIGKTLADNGIYCPLVNGLKISFPPVNFKLEKPLYVLVVSPRDKIDRIKDVTLVQSISLEQKEALESQVDNLDVSSLVIQIGGLGATVPTFVEDGADLKWTLETVAHEWVHQYLAFKPLGVRYVLDLLGISSQPDVDTINETVANIIGKEIGDQVYVKYYAGSLPEEKPVVATPDPLRFDFNAAMRDIRRTVDAYLAQEQVQQAEEYMQTKQHVLASQGYYIRKLNQAYFAFYGSYADSPTSIDPIGVKLNSLRQESPSLKDFLDKASGLTSAADLDELVRNSKLVK
jgi:hypothetical protein